MIRLRRMLRIWRDRWAELRRALREVASEN